MTYAQILKTPIPQSKPASPKQAKNNAGGYSFQLDKWARLERFLILGSLNGTYYVDAQDLTKQNLNIVRECLAENPVKAISLIHDVSTKGRSFNNDAPLLAYTLAMSMAGAARDAAKVSFNDIVRTGSHLLTFGNYYKALGGDWGRSVRRAVEHWYTTKTPDNLAYQVIKYQQRNNWAHRDLLRMAHPKPAAGSGLDALLAWMVKEVFKADSAPHLLSVYEAAKKATTESEIVALIKGERLTWEFVPGQWLGNANVWRALLPNLPMTALVRNLARMTANGVIAPLSDEAHFITKRLGDREAIKKARLHPLSLLNAWKVYASGKGVKGSLTWNPEQTVLGNLEGAFLMSFDDVAPTGKRVYWAQDVSGSMSGAVAGKMQVTCAEAGAAMIMAFAKSEERLHVAGFAGELRPLKITKRTSFQSAIREVNDSNFGSTDCALPMLDALEKKIPVDLFVVCTDSETWQGRIHAHVALEQYREKMGIPAKMVVIGMTSTGFTIANPDDPGMMDVVGMDTQVFNLVRQFSGSQEGNTDEAALSD